MADIFRAKEAFAYTNKEGLPRIVAPGDLMSSDDPDFKGKEHLYEPVEVAMSRASRVRAGDSSAVETATAEPGEKRSRGRPRRGLRDVSLPEVESSDDASEKGDK